VFARIAWLDGNFKEAQSLYLELIERLALLGEKAFRSDATAELGLLAIEQGNLQQAQIYLEQALTLAHGAGREHKIALRLIELSNLFYLQGNLNEFRQNTRDGLSFNNYFLEDYKVQILETILGSLYTQKSENATRLLGAINRYSESEYGYPIDPLYKRYCDRAEIYARKTLGNTIFESLFAEGQKMSLDKARDLALNTVEEM
jgi:tetratricopeptide (TPR) repeat protein